MSVRRWGYTYGGGVCCTIRSKTMTDHTTIEPGKTYTLSYKPGDWTIQVTATSEIWTNSKGITAFFGTLHEPMGNKDAGDKSAFQTHIFEVVA